MRRSTGHGCTMNPPSAHCACTRKPRASRRPERMFRTTTWRWYRGATTRPSDSGWKPIAASRSIRERLTSCWMRIPNFSKQPCFTRPATWSWTCSRAAAGWTGWRWHRFRSEYPRTAYILLDADPELFETTMFHETGHVVMDMLAGGRRLDGLEVASIPHSTAALSDRTTAFSEGYAIHLETLAAHLARGADLRSRYQHHGVGFGDVPYRQSEYYRGASDLTTFSQDMARYYEVRENHFAFESAFRGPDYLRVQLEKTRDFSTLREANQLLQSEGFYASFFFLFAMRGADLPAEETVARREEKMLRAMAAMFAAVKTDISTPWLLERVTQYMRLYPEERAEIVDALNDLSHGVFVDPGASALWQEHYLASLGLDLAHFNREAVNAAGNRWPVQGMADPHILFSRIGPEIVCTVPAVTVRLAAFGEDAQLRFDVNAVQEGILRLVPGMADAEIARFAAERAKAPFASAGDFRRRVALRAATLAGVNM